MIDIQNCISCTVMYKHTVYKNSTKLVHKNEYKINQTFMLQ